MTTFKNYSQSYRERCSDLRTRRTPVPCSVCSHFEVRGVLGRRGPRIVSGVPSSVDLPCVEGG